MQILSQVDARSFEEATLLRLLERRCSYLKLDPFFIHCFLPFGSFLFHPDLLYEYYL